MRKPLGNRYPTTRSIYIDTRLTGTLGMRSDVILVASHIHVGPSAARFGVAGRRFQNGNRHQTLLRAAADAAADQARTQAHQAELGVGRRTDSAVQHLHLLALRYGYLVGAGSSRVFGHHPCHLDDAGLQESNEDTIGVKLSKWHRYTEIRSVKLNR